MGTFGYWILKSDNYDSLRGITPSFLSAGKLASPTTETPWTPPESRKNDIFTPFIVPVDDTMVFFLRQSQPPQTLIAS